MTKDEEQKQQKYCRDCPIKCNQPKKAKKNKLVTYAQLWRLDKNSPGFSDFVAEYHYRCDDLGLDAFEVAGALAIAIHGAYIDGNSESILAVLEEISQGTELGKIIGNGAEAASKHWGIARSELELKKDTGKQEDEQIFLDSLGLCSFAYAHLKQNPDLWKALEELLKAKYGPSFDCGQLARSFD